MSSTIPLIVLRVAVGTAEALVPVAMSSFRTVVTGVGTVHAPFAAGGIAATLQVAFFLEAATVAAGAAGAAAAAIFV